jgi:hypothetical protein
MRGWVGICAFAVILVGCESAEEKCNAAREEMRSGLQDAAHETVGTARAASEARGAAMEALSTAVMDLGNVRSDEVVEAIGGGEDGAVGVEVSVGAMMAALLAMDRLADDDAETSDEIGTAVQQEIEGRYRELMTWDPTREGASEHLAEIGDGCSTDMQLLIRPLPSPVRSAVLARYTALHANEGEPDEATDYSRVTTAFTSYLEAHAAAAAANEQSAAIVAALDGLDGSVHDARALFEALPEDLELGPARTAAPIAWEACAGE